MSVERRMEWRALQVILRYRYQDIMWQPDNREITGIEYRATSPANEKKFTVKVVSNSWSQGRIKGEERSSVG